MGFLGIYNIGIAVKDVSSVSKFFVEKVGLDVEIKYNSIPVYARVKIGENYLFLFETSNVEVLKKRDVNVTENPVGLDHIAILCDDIDAKFVAMRDMGVEFLGEPQSFFNWNIRMVGFKDLEGNWYYLAQKLS